MHPHSEILARMAPLRNPGHPTCFRGTMQHVAAIAKPAAQSLGREYIEVNLVETDDTELLRIFEDSLHKPVWAFFHDLHLVHHTKRALLMEYLFEAPGTDSFLCVVVDPAHYDKRVVNPTFASKMYHLDVDQNGITSEPIATHEKTTR